MSDEMNNDTDNTMNKSENQSKTEQGSVNPVILEELNEEKKSEVSLESIDKLGDVELPVRVIFANISKSFEEVLAYTEGDIVKLNRFAGEPVDIFVGDRVFAKGEITVVDDFFGVRIVEILPSGERLAPQ